MELHAVQRMVGRQFAFQLAHEGVGLIRDKFAPRFQKIDVLATSNIVLAVIDGAVASVAFTRSSCMVPAQMRLAWIRFSNPCPSNCSQQINDLHLEAEVQNSYVDTSILL